MDNRPSKPFRAALITLLIFTNLLVGLISAYTLFQKKQHYEQSAAAQTQSMAVAIDQSISKSIEKIDLALLALTDELQRASARPADQPYLHHLFKEYLTRLSEVESLRATNADGDIVYGNLVDPSKRIGLQDRDYFRYFSTHQDKALFVSGPFVGRISNHHVLVFSRRFNNADGSFAGVVYATIPVAYFDSLLSTLSVGSNGIVVLRTEMLQLISRVPKSVNESSNQIGNTLVSPDLRQLIEAKLATATYHTENTAEGIERTVTVRRISNAPIYALAGLASQDYLMGWWFDVQKNIVFTVILLALSVVSWFALKRLLDRLDQQAAEIREFAFHDPLTGLPNRRLLLDRLQVALSGVQRFGNCGAVLFLDLDRFKLLNDAKGHDYGDLLLIEVSKRISANVRSGDTVARLGGDEFIVMLTNLDQDMKTACDQADRVGRKLLEALCEPYQLNDQPFSCTASIGVCLFDRQLAHLPDEIMHRADQAMYSAKAAGKSVLRFYDPALCVRPATLTD